jgi:rhomboid family GlyGly-CTERM serine protease
MPFSPFGRRSLAERHAQPGLTWVTLALAACAGAVIAWSLPPEWLEWQPALVGSQPWRAYTAAFVHYSGLHLGANLAGGVLVAALGWSARIPWSSTLAWLGAWPTLHLVLLVQPALRHYGGLSGLWHAGVAVVGVHLLWRGAPRARWIGGALLVGLLVKVLAEAPWAGPVRYAAGWDIAIAPLAHASGAAAGVVWALLMNGWARRRRQQPA